MTHGVVFDRFRQRSQTTVFTKSSERVITGTYFISIERFLFYSSEFFPAGTRGGDSGVLWAGQD
jgi:hypothetical protein